MLTRHKPFQRLIALCLILVVVMPVSTVWADTVIKDPALAEAIKNELKLSAHDGELGIEELQRLKSLYPQNADVKITDLQGLEHAVNMQSLFLPGHHVTDLAPVGKLKKLTFLAVEGNRITDLSPLSGLNVLQKLVIDGNQVENLEPLNQLSGLTDLLASNNQVSDLRPVQSLKLKWLLVNGNQIQDLGPLRNHPTLEHLYLDDNLIQDIEVLDTLPSLKTVSLANNPLNDHAEQLIAKLTEKGVNVQSHKKQTQPAGIQVILDAERVDFPVPPFIEEGVTMVPFRTLFEKLGLTVTWIGDSQTIIGEKEDTAIRMQIGQTSAEVNGKAVELAAAPSIVSGSTFVPLRFVAEAMDAKVEWNGANQTALIRSKQRFTSSGGSVAVTAYGKWTPIKVPSSESDQLAIQTFSWSMFVVNAIQRQELPETTDFAQFYKDIKTEVLDDSIFEFISEQEVKFREYPAKKLVYRLMEDGWKPFVCTTLFFEANGRYYQITAAANEELLKSAQEELNEILDSLELLK